MLRMMLRCSTCWGNDLHTLQPHGVDRSSPWCFLTFGFPHDFWIPCYLCFLPFHSHPGLSEVLQVSERPVPGGVQSKAAHGHAGLLFKPSCPTWLCLYSSLGAWIMPLSPNSSSGKAPAIPENVSEQLKLFIRENLIRRLLFMWFYFNGLATRFISQLTCFTIWSLQQSIDILLA